jgi:hypothetical protein
VGVFQPHNIPQQMLPNGQADNIDRSADMFQEPDHLFELHRTLHDAVERIPPRTFPVCNTARCASNCSISTH